MTKKELIDALTGETGLSRADSLCAVEGLMTVMADAFASGKSIYLRGLGTFRVRRTKEKVARDISRKQAVIVPSHLKVKFIPSETLRKRLHNNEQ